MRKMKEIKKKFDRERALNRLAKPGPFELILVLDHLKVGFNIGKIFRSAEVFGCHEVHLIGTSFFDPYPSKGGFKNVPARFHENFQACYDELTNRGYELVCLDPSAEKTLPEFKLEPRMAFVMGHEEFGFSFAMESFDKLKTAKIPQFGKTQSLNVAVAASVAMYEYVRQQSY